MISRRWGPPSVANKNAHVPLVMLHGLLGDSGDWQPVIDRLPAIRCIALDLPGHGQHSDLNVGDFEQSHQWLVAELASRNIERYLLAGYSLGGGGWPSTTPAASPPGCGGYCWRTATRGYRPVSGPPASPTMRAGQGASSASLWLTC